MYYQISYPRSGANWLRYIARNLLDVNKDVLDPDGSNDPYIKCHLFPKNPELNREIILLIRNPKEAIVRHVEVDNPLIFEDVNIFQEAANIYLMIIQNFLNWPGEKGLIYYEDLIESPENIINSLCAWFKVDKIKAEMFLSDFEKHRKKCYDEYTNFHGVYTDGQTAIYHSKKLSKKQRHKWDMWFAKKDPLIWENYLLRYVG